MFSQIFLIYHSVLFHECNQHIDLNLSYLFHLNFRSMRVIILANLVMKFIK